MARHAGRDGTCRMLHSIARCTLTCYFYILFCAQFFCYLLKFLCKGSWAMYEEWYGKFSVLYCVAHHAGRDDARGSRVHPITQCIVARYFLIVCFYVRIFWIWKKRSFLFSDFTGSPPSTSDLNFLRFFSDWCHFLGNLKRYLEWLIKRIKNFLFTFFELWEEKLLFWFFFCRGGLQTPTQAPHYLSG